MLRKLGTAKCEALATQNSSSRIDHESYRLALSRKFINDIVSSQCFMQTMAGMEAGGAYEGEGEINRAITFHWKCQGISLRSGKSPKSVKGQRICVVGEI